MIIILHSMLHPAQVIAKGLISSVAVVWLANSGPRPDGHKVILFSERIVQRLSSCNIILLTYIGREASYEFSCHKYASFDLQARTHSVSPPHTWFQTCTENNRDNYGEGDSIDWPDLRREGRKAVRGRRPQTL